MGKRDKNKPRTEYGEKTMRLKINGKNVNVTGYTAAMEIISRYATGLLKVAVYLDTAGKKFETVVMPNTSFEVDRSPEKLLVGMYDSRISRLSFSTDIYLAATYGSYPI